MQIPRSTEFQFQFQPKLKMAVSIGMKFAEAEITNWESNTPSVSMTAAQV